MPPDNGAYMVAAYIAAAFIITAYAAYLFIRSRRLR